MRSSPCWAYSLSAQRILFPKFRPKNQTDKLLFVYRYLWEEIIILPSWGPRCSSPSFGKVVTLEHCLRVTEILIDGYVWAMCLSYTETNHTRLHRAGEWFTVLGYLWPTVYQSACLFVSLTPIFFVYFLIATVIFYTHSTCMILNQKHRNVTLKRISADQNTFRTGIRLTWFLWKIITINIFAMCSEAAEKTVLLSLFR